LLRCSKARGNAVHAETSGDVEEEGWPAFSSYSYTAGDSFRLKPSFLRFGRTHSNRAEVHDRSDAGTSGPQFETMMSNVSRSVTSIATVWTIASATSMNL
jgi:hypothetical protein